MLHSKFHYRIDTIYEDGDTHEITHELIYNFNFKLIDGNRHRDSFNFLDFYESKKLLLFCMRHDLLQNCKLGHAF